MAQPCRRLWPRPSVPKWSLVIVKEMVTTKRQHGKRIGVEYHYMACNCEIVCPHHWPLDGKVDGRQTVDFLRAFLGVNRVTQTCIEHHLWPLQLMECHIRHCCKPFRHRIDIVGDDVEAWEADHVLYIATHPKCSQRLVSLLRRRLEQHLGLVPDAGQVTARRRRRHGLLSKERTARASKAQELSGAEGLELYFILLYGVRPGSSYSPEWCESAKTVGCGV